MLKLPLALDFIDDSNSASSNTYFTFPVECIEWRGFEQLAAETVQNELQLLVNNQFSFLWPRASLVCDRETEVNSAVFNYCLSRIQLLLDDKIIRESIPGFRFRAGPLPSNLPLELPPSPDAA